MRVILLALLCSCSQAPLGANQADLAVADLARSPDLAQANSVPCASACMCMSGMCTFECGASGCQPAECIGANCGATCAGGGCELDCDEGSVCDYQCPGGNCTFDCDLSANCTLACPKGGCDLLCDGNSTCALDCTGATTRCSIACEKGGHATCKGNCDQPSC